MSHATMPQGRIPLAYATINGERVPVIIDLEWARFLDSLNEHSITGGAEASDVTAINVFAQRGPTFQSERALEGDQVLSTVAFMPKPPTLQAQQALVQNGDSVFLNSAFQRRQPTYQALKALEPADSALLGALSFVPRATTFQASVALESNSNAILASQIFGA